VLDLDELRLVAGAMRASNGSMRNASGRSVLYSIDFSRTTSTTMLCFWRMRNIVGASLS
jgi:hypothetical protein